MPHACSPTMCNHYLVVLSLLESCWRTLLFLLENKDLSEDSDSNPLRLKYGNQKAWLGLTSGLTQELVFFVKTQCPKRFVDAFTVIQQAGQVTETPRSNPCPDLVSRCLKQVNPTVQCEKGPPQTSQICSVYPWVRTQGPNWNCTKRMWSYKARRLSSSLIRNSTQCSNNTLDRLHGLPQKEKQENPWAFLI